MKMYGPTMQCNSKTLNYVRCGKCSSLAITEGILRVTNSLYNNNNSCHRPKSPSINSLINDCLSVNHTYYASTYQHPAQNIDTWQTHCCSTGKIL